MRIELIFSGSEPDVLTIILTASPDASKEYDLVFEKPGLLEIITQAIMEGKMDWLIDLIEKKTI